MWTDGDVGDLHRMAEKLGLKRTYFQNKSGFPHYDVIPMKRAQAIKWGAVFMPLKEWIKKCQ
jgi:NADH:ubiquinone oxidoreductase subunit D